MVVDAKAPLKAIAAALKREQEEAGLSLTEVARQAEIAKSTLSQLEAGTDNPNLETLWALVGPADSAVELGPGDYISYPGDVSHTSQALEPGTTAVLILERR